MTSQQNLKTATLMMVIFLITAIVCYAFFPPPAPEEPIRLMFQNKGGNVLFTHSGHTGKYSLDCLSCHHNINDDAIYNCSQCHERTGVENIPSRPDAFHSQCRGCHEEQGLGPVECNSCHLKDLS